MGGLPAEDLSAFAPSGPDALSLGGAPGLTPEASPAEGGLGGLGTLSLDFLTGGPDTGAMPPAAPAAPAPGAGVRGHDTFSLDFLEGGGPGAPAPGPEAFSPPGSAFEPPPAAAIGGSEAGDGISRWGLDLDPTAGDISSAPPDDGPATGEHAGGAGAPEAAAHPWGTAGIGSVTETTADLSPAETLPQLAAPKRRQAAVEASRGSRRAPAWQRAAIAVGAVAIAGGLGFAAWKIVPPMFSSGPTMAELLGPAGKGAGLDRYEAYVAAAEHLNGLQVRPKMKASVRAQSAELLLLGVLGRGAPRSQMLKAQQVLEDVGKVEIDDVPGLARARALLAVAKGQGGEVDGLLAKLPEAPENHLIVGLRRLRENKLDQAAAALRKAAGAGTYPVLGQYLLGRALEQSGKPDAKAAYEKVVAKNPDHLGARAALLRVAPPPPDDLFAKAEALLTAAKAGASPDERADVYLLHARASQGLGRNEEAIGALTRAVDLVPDKQAAVLALAEALLGEGRNEEALARLRAGGPAITKAARGKFALGGAQLGAGQRDEGLGLIKQASTEAPADPRGAYWQGIADEKAMPPDLESAMRNHRAALSRDGAFLPAILRLAGLLQRRGKADETLALLKDAEKAGAPPMALQLALGEALIVAREPQRAEEVFRKTAGANPSLTAAHVGVANAIEVAGKPEEARAYLEDVIGKLAGGGVGVRPKLAELLAKAGRREEALQQLRDEIATGKATPGVRVAMARLAVDLGKLDIADVELEKVIKENMATPGALYTRARLLDARGQIQDAIRDFRLSLLYEDLPEIHLAFGRVLVKAGKDLDALNQFAAASSLAAARVERGRLLLRTADVAGAMKEFEEATKLAPEDASARLQLGVCLDRMGNHDLAAESWRKAVAADPKSSEAHYRIGRYEMDRGKAGAALPHLRAAAAGVSGGGTWEADLFFQLGYAELSARARPAAVAALRRYMDLAPEDAPARPEVRRELERLGAR
jgi:tetratricopeptide (TPR) repeat protein